MVGLWSRVEKCTFEELSSNRFLVFYFRWLEKIVIEIGIVAYFLFDFPPSKLEPLLEIIPFDRERKPRESPQLINKK